MCLGINECHHIILVAYSDGLPVRTPTDINVLAWEPRYDQQNTVSPQSSSSLSCYQRKTRAITRVHSLRSSSVGGHTLQHTHLHISLFSTHMSLRDIFPPQLTDEKLKRDGPKYPSYEVTEPRSKCILVIRASSSLLCLHFPNSSHSHAIFTIFELSM